MAQYALTAALANPRPAATTAATGAAPLNRPLIEQAWLGERHVPFPRRQTRPTTSIAPSFTHTRFPAQRRTGGAAVDPADVEAWSVSTEGKAFVVAASDGWGAAAIADGDDAETAQRRAASVGAFYSGELPGPEE
jgi:hypothetical protein